MVVVKGFGMENDTSFLHKNAIVVDLFWGWVLGCLIHHEAVAESLLMERWYKSQSCASL